MRLTLERQPGSRDRITEPQAEAIDRKWPAVPGIDNGQVVAIADGQNVEQVSVERNRELPLSFCCTTRIVPPLTSAHVIRCTSLRR